jgi:hypothetical protein
MSRDQWQGETMSFEEAAARLAELENMDIREFLTDGKPDITKILLKHRTDLVRSIKVDNVGKVVSIELHPHGAGNLYLITSDSGYTKIGYAEDMYKRFAQIDVSSPSRLTIHYFRWVKRVRALESSLHEKFSHLRVKGEWFKLSDGDLAEAVRMIDAHE